MKKLFAICSFFIRSDTYKNYTNIILVIIAESKSDAIGKFLLSSEVKSTLDKGYTMIGNPPVCVEIDIELYLKKTEWLSENGYIKDIDYIDMGLNQLDEDYKKTFSYDKI